MVAEVNRMTPFLDANKDFERMFNAAVLHAKQDSIGLHSPDQLARIVGVNDWLLYLETWRDYAGSQWPISSASREERLAADVARHTEEFRKYLTELNETDDPKRRQELTDVCHFMVPTGPGLSPELDALAREFLLRYDERFQSKE
jgi:hypothetical protein